MFRNKVVTMPNFIKAIMSLFNDLHQDIDAQNIFKDSIESQLPHKVLLQLRDDNDFNWWLRHTILVLVVTKAEKIYGECDTAFTIYPDPDLNSSPRSRICPEKGNHKNIIVCMGSYVLTWEDFFYEICHESIHLLNPVIDIKNNPSSALDEGVAVKFAEIMFNTYIKPYHEYPPNNSPLNPIAGNNNYNKSYQIANKIPDDVLFEIRKEFTAFTRINNVSKFAEFTDNYIDNNEIKFISDHFVY